MSEPKRYRLDSESYLAEHPHGDFVDYQDYARLKAEVERLTKAGEDLVTCVLIMRHNNPYDIEDIRLVILNWNAAKEGKLGA